MNSLFYLKLKRGGGVIQKKGNNLLNTGLARFSLSQYEFTQRSLYKEYASFNFSNFPICPAGFAKLCSPLVHTSVPTLLGLQANVTQGGRVGKGGRGLDFPYWSQKNQQR